jgi:hypothetical protein
VLDTTSSIDPNIYAEMTGSYPKTELVPLEPDIFGESFVLDEIEDRNVWSNSSDLLNAAWNLEPSKTTAFAIRCVMDFPEHPAIRQLLNRERVPVEHVAWWVRLAIGCLFAYRGRSISFEEWRRIYNEIAAELSTSSLQTTDHRPMELFLRKGFIFYCVRNERLLEAREALDTLLEMQIDVNSREAVEKTQIESITILLGSASFQDLKYAERMHLTIRRIASRAPPFATDICDAMKVLAWQMIRSGRLADAMAIVEEVEAIVDRDAEDLGTRRVHGELTEMMIDEYGKLGDLKSAAARLEAHFDNRATGPLRVDEQNVRSLQVATINGIPSIILVSCALCRQYALSRQWDLAVTEFRRAKSLAGINNFRSYCGILGELLLSLVCTSREQLQLAYAVTLLNEFMEGDLHHEEGEWVAESVTALLFGLCDEAEKQEKRGVQDVLRLDAMVISLYDQMPANYVIAWSRARCAGRLATFMGEIIGDTIAALSYLETAARLGEELEADPRFLESVRTLQVMYGKAEKV